jgi:hypothetical protein
VKQGVKRSLCHKEVPLNKEKYFKDWSCVRDAAWGRYIFIKNRDIHIIFFIKCLLLFFHFIF